MGIARAIGRAVGRGMRKVRKVKPKRLLKATAAKGRRFAKRNPGKTAVTTAGLGAIAGGRMAGSRKKKRRDY